MTNKEKALDLIQTAQDAEKNESLLWYVAEDLKTMVQEATEEEAGIVAADLEGGSHTLQSCEGKIQEYAGKHRSGKVGICPGAAVAKILREHFGLTAKAKAAEPEQGKAENPEPAAQPAKHKRLNIMDFMD